MKRVLLVAVLMLLGSVACYSDSPLWVFGVTDTPPTATFLPTPDYDKYPAKLGEDQVGLAPIPSGGQTQRFFFVTRAPEELIAGVRNASGQCDYNAELEVLYIGHQWQEFEGSLYVDTVELGAGGEDAATNNVLFDFESDNQWTVVDDGQGSDNESVNVADNVNFNQLRGDASTLDVSNNTRVLELGMKFAENDWEATFSTAFEAAQDWSAYETLTVTIFVPSNAEQFVVSLQINTSDGTQPAASASNELTVGIWNTVTFDLSTIENRSSVESFGMTVGPTPASTYYLVACSGTVGWANEDRIAGPLLFVSGQSAQTRPISERGAPIAAGQPFMINGGAEPPLGPLPASNQCAVNEVVDVVSVSSVGQVIWYEIRCGNTTGWVTEDRLFGPLALPATNGIGVVEGDENMNAQILTMNAGELSEENPAVGECAANSIITTLGFQTLGEGDERIPYYNITCGDLTGWISQDPLREIPYPLGAITILVGVFDAEDVVATVEDAVEDTDAADTTTDDAATDDPAIDTPQTDDQSFIDPRFRPITLTTAPAPATEDNIAGECPSSTVVELEDVATSLGIIFYQITCNGINGWVEATRIPNIVYYPPGETLWFNTPTKNAQGQTQAGFAVYQAPNQTATQIGQCALFEPVEVVQVVFEERALKRLGYRLYYQVSCTNIAGEPLIGWQELELESDKITTRNPLKIVGG